MGVDMATHDELIAHGRTVEEIREHIGADSLAYLSHEGMMRPSASPLTTAAIAAPASPGTIRSGWKSGGCARSQEKLAFEDVWG